MAADRKLGPTRHELKGPLLSRARRTIGRARSRTVAAAAAVVLAAVSGCSSTTGQTGLVTCGVGSVEGWTDEQVQNASAIVSVALGLGLGSQGALIGVTTAITESTLRSVNYGDIMASGAMSSSRGLFQQLDPWGSLSDRLDPVKAATMFYTGGAAGQRGLMDIPGWQQMSVPAAAQAVEQSEFTDGSNYAKNVKAATALTSALVPTCSGSAGGGGPASAVGQTIVAAAMTQLGVPYVWGGGGINGPSGIDEVDGRGPGFDCSALVQWAVYTATGGRVTLARTAAEQALSAGQPVPADLSQMQPGDLIAFDNGPRVPGADHIGIYIGNGKMVNAPQSTDNVRIDDLTSGYYADRAQWSVRRIS